jgi:integrase
VVLLPRIGQPVGQLTDRRGREVGQQLREIPMRVDLMPAAGAGQAAQDGRDGRSLPYNTVRCTFRRLCRKLKWQSNGALPLPRIHDLRHSFACRRLLRWYQTGVNVDHAIGALSTYLGHGKVTDTYWYLSGTGELLSVAGRRFERFATLAGRQL